MNNLDECVVFFVNKHGNYSFSVRKSEVLCLNKRVVELGVGACVAFSTYTYMNNFNTPRVLWHYSVLGLVGLCKISGYQGLRFLLLTSTIFRGGLGKASLLGLQLSPIISTYLNTLYLIGQALVLVTPASMLLIGSSFVISKCGGEFMNNLLNRFNNWQNNVGFLEIKDDLDYQLTVIGRDILCLKKKVFQAAWVLGFILAFYMVFSNSSNFAIDSSSALLNIYFQIFMGGVLAISKILGEKTWIISLFIEFLDILDPSSCKLYFAYGVMLLLVIGKATLMTGIGFGTFALLSSLVKKSGSEKLTNLKKFLNNLEDKKKVIEYERDLKSKRLALEKRREEIRVINSRINSEANTYPTEDLRSGSTESVHTKQDNVPRTKIKRTGPNNQGASRSVSVAGKKSTEIPTQIEISINGCDYVFQQLTGTACDKKNVWGVIISDSSNSEKYQKCLNNGRIGQNASIRQLKSGGSTFEIGKKMDSRLIGHMYKPGDISNALKAHLSIDVASFVQEIKGNCGEDTCLIIFSSEAKKHQDISKTSRQLK